MGYRMSQEEWRERGGQKVALGLSILKKQNEKWSKVRD